MKLKYKYNLAVVCIVHKGTYKVCIDVSKVCIVVSKVCIVVSKVCIVVSKV